ncbi:hypothetical protein DIE07_08910 [Burkholderia sp. Bp9002]|nr:hypothetical protein DIE07_08910 [Burkholderia sp. Bp9002]
MRRMPPDMRTAMPAAAQRTEAGSGVSALKHKRVFHYVFLRPSRHGAGRHRAAPLCGAQCTPA